MGHEDAFSDDRGRVPSLADDGPVRSRGP